ncbi:MAG: DNA repair protein RecO [Candidatus Omnitrophica bacterium]|nr:DNA repair protein RecO [Candidatus Omnitrophota bacterium]MCM8816605.1 DNA repair protein RecO [Candidatus Omnitrophota bacterium]
MPPTKVKAIVLKKINFRETSVIVHLLTDSIGKIHGIMKGVRNPTKKIPPLAYQQGSFIEAFVYLKPKSGLELVTKPEIIDSFNFKDEAGILWHRLLSDLDRFIPASRFNSQEIYDLLVQTGNIIPQVKNHRAIELLVTERILYYLGFGPFLEKCLVCGKSENLYFFSGKLGGVVCSNCRARETTAFRLPPKHIQVLKFFHKIPISQIPMIKYIPEGLYKNLKKCLDEIVEYHLVD